MMMTAIYIVTLVVFMPLMVGIAAALATRWQGRHDRRLMDIRERNVRIREDALSDGWDEFRLWAESEREGLREQRAEFRAERIKLGAKAHDLRTQIHLWQLENDTTRIQRTV